MALGTLVAVGLLIIFIAEICGASVEGKNGQAVLLFNNNIVERHEHACREKCFRGWRAKRRAKKGCSRKFCTVQECMRKGRKGFVCSPKVTMMKPVDLADIKFAKSAKVGTKATLTFPVTVDESSSAPKEDIYFLTDATGSMNTQIDEVKERLGDVKEARPGSYFGVGIYRDEDDPSEAFKNSQPITEDMTDVLAAIDDLEAVRGGDSPEANLYALSEVATSSAIGWRDGARKIVVWLGDEPGHEPTCPGANPMKPITRDSVCTELNTKGIAVVGLSFYGGLDKRTFSKVEGNFSCGATVKRTEGRQGTKITSCTYGALVPSTSNTGFISSVISAIGDLDQVLEVDTTRCDGLVDIAFSPYLPRFISTGSSVTITQTATILAAACPKFSCSIKLLLSGVEFRQNIVASSISGC